MSHTLPGLSETETSAYHELGVRKACWDIMTGNPSAPDSQYYRQALRELKNGKGDFLIRDRARINECSVARICDRDGVLDEFRPQ